MRLAIIATHPVQYYAPLWRELAGRVDLTVFFAHHARPEQQAAAGFGTAFEWDVDLFGGYKHRFLTNVAAHPDASRRDGCDTPEIGERLAEGGFDAVMTVGWYSKTHIQAIRAARRLRIPVMVRSDSQLGLQPSAGKRLAKRIAYPVLLRAFDAVLATGTRSAAFFRAYGYPQRRIFVSPHAVDTPRFAAVTPEAAAAVRCAAGIAPDAKVVLFAGKLVPFKRPLDVVDAIARLRAEGVMAEVMVAGAGELEPAMRARAAEAGVPLHVLGFVNQTGMPAAYAAADVLALPSTGRETWGLVANEALASGTPVVVSHEAGCAPDIGADGVAGRIFTGGDVGALASAVRAVLAAPPSVEAMAAVSARFSLARAAEGIVAASAACAARR
ncbi:glycosyltransferase family 4 protein [Acuticoccus yangtzensis]|uniref:glycosyltransferase family 4 protein n=1 Tax=Acuticoccus yangtzensis TaxID=1443441 RepID=UPI0009497010|nr:glycosyltransferase family 4 protein [Acuticoccus yangtzensis]